MGALLPTVAAHITAVHQRDDSIVANYIAARSKPGTINPVTICRPIVPTGAPEKIP